MVLDLRCFLLSGMPGSASTSDPSSEHSGLTRKKKNSIQFNYLFHFAQVNTNFTVFHVIYIINKLYIVWYSYEICNYWSRD